MIQRQILLALLGALLLACGSADETPTPASDPEPEPAAPVAEPEPEPEPPPPAEVPTCPEDTWSVAANGPNRATESGVEAAGWVRGMGTSWSTLRVCRTIDGHEVRLSCAPVPRGAECSLSLPRESCTATLPAPMLTPVVGQLIDTRGRPTEGTWSCRPR